MNIVIFGKGFRSPRQVRLTSATTSLSITFLIVLIVSAGFFIGSWYSSRTISEVSIEDLQGFAAQLEEQRSSISAIRQENEDTLDALSIRVAQMSARMIRLDVIGRRLTDMANIDDGEFDFNSNPAVGGPEEPMLSRSNVVVPRMLNTMNSLDEQLSNRETQLDVLESILINQNLKNRIYPQGRPVNSGWISSYYGKRTDPFTGKVANHSGIDFAGKIGAEIVAVADGVVTWSADRYGYGIMVEITHGIGYSTRYAHNSENLVSVGDEVKKGQIIALMGETGRATGPNLHFEVLHNGFQVDPAKFIRESTR
jgi:septal ring factor EnvC (AmiA/AmiB activator)